MSHTVEEEMIERYKVVVDGLKIIQEDMNIAENYLKKNKNNEAKSKLQRCQKRLNLIMQEVL